MQIIRNSSKFLYIKIKVKNLMKLFFLFMVNGFLLLSFTPVQAQNRYPDKPINIIVPFAPGGGNDLVSRLISEPLGEILKQSVIVVNKAGAGGSIGTSYVAKAAPDGYNLVMANNSNVTYPDIEKLTARKPSYEMSQLEPLAMLSNDPLFLVVRSDSPFKTAAELVKAAQAKPDSIDYASSGNLGPIHVQFELIGDAVKTSFNQIQYKGVGPGVLALLSGEVQTTTVNPGTLSGQLGSGKIRVLAVTGDKRHTLVPDAPTLNELGIDVRYSLWFGLFVTAGTPSDVVLRLRVAIQEVSKSEKFITGLQKAGFQLDYRDAPDFKKYYTEDSGKVMKVLQKVVKPEPVKN
jgi:tripartite-type tricarboxylate transporter receptor subunit TctC